MTIMFASTLDMSIANRLKSLKLIAPNSDRLYPLFWEKYQHLLQFSIPPRVLLNEPEPVPFLAGFFAAVATNSPVFLGHPNWTISEWEMVWQQVQPEVVWGTVPCTPVFVSPPPPFPGTIMIATGGSSGKIRLAMHTWETLSASVQGFITYFDRRPIHSCCTLALYHVSGLMQVLRAFLTGGQVVILSYQSLQQLERMINPQDYFISLVPTQLKRLLAEPKSILSQFHTVLLGGAPAWPDLLQQAKEAKIQVALTYGMTETASQVATLQPELFFQGNTSCGQRLPHAQITIQNDRAEDLLPLQIGQVAIAAQSLCLGYFPYPFDPPSSLLTDDIGYLDRQGFLYILGRHSHTIITGGEKVFPQEVEGTILATQLVQDVAVIGIPNEDWGEVVTAVYVPKYPEITPQKVQQAIAPRLSRYKHPKHWVTLGKLPRSAQGKLNRQQLRYLIEKQHSYPLQSSHIGD